VNESQAKLKQLQKCSTKTSGRSTPSFHSGSKPAKRDLALQENSQLLNALNADEVTAILRQKRSLLSFIPHAEIKVPKKGFLETDPTTERIDSAPSIQRETADTEK
jgi:hypothetical protein